MLAYNIRMQKKKKEKETQTRQTVTEICKTFHIATQNQSSSCTLK